jgi:ankyrin repeat protein
MRRIDRDFLNASESGHTEVVHLLLNAGANVHAINNYAIRLASSNGYTGVVQLLLNVGAKVHAGDDEAIRWARRNGHTEIVHLLLAHYHKNNLTIPKEFTNVA